MTTAPEHQMCAKMEEEKGKDGGCSETSAVRNPLAGASAEHFHIRDVIQIHILCRVVAPGSVLGPLLFPVMVLKATFSE